MVVEIISRDGWGAHPPRETFNLIPITKAVEHVFFTNTNTDNCDSFQTCGEIMRRKQLNALTFKHLDDYNFNFMVGGDGRVYEGRGWAHCPLLPTKFSEYADSSIYIAFIGTFIDKRPNELMRRARFQLVQNGISSGLIVQDYWWHDIVMPIYRRRKPSPDYLKMYRVGEEYR